MPPEQWRAKAVRASDQYALAIVVYQWLCGELPFRGTALEVMGQHINLPPPSLRIKNPAIEEDLESVVMKALAKDPEQRFHTILEFAEALEMAAKQVSLELLLTLPIQEGERIQDVDWIWGNHYLFILRSKKMEIIDVITGETVFSEIFKNYYVAVFWEREDCTVSFPKGVISLTGTTDHPCLIDIRTGKTIAWIATDDVLADWLNEKDEGFGVFSDFISARLAETLKSEGYCGIRSVESYLISKCLQSLPIAHLLPDLKDTQSSLLVLCQAKNEKICSRK